MQFLSIISLHHTFESLFATFIVNNDLIYKNNQNLKIVVTNLVVSIDLFSPGIARFHKMEYFSCIKAF